MDKTFLHRIRFIKFNLIKGTPMYNLEQSIPQGKDLIQPNYVID